MLRILEKILEIFRIFGPVRMESSRPAIPSTARAAPVGDAMMTMAASPMKPGAKRAAAAVGAARAIRAGIERRAVLCGTLAHFFF